ncbi:unnamed protein product (macronuclear) [Paramecium tetraurelia]|uniref:RING-type domain-containing protein n=1 Tax=Paramecium tetraurelia TaxID=5888 RepID=A0C4A2_PARTE|nr:uncharacterized protein GSPATT00035099001 [Paramecium tetraurelia]CAK65619.1 unnamed protein product [Paramecium tetraurelia]|eukprot:XP_001433016.1 hypothetical protein (macronuclear) [Paramecium tetraurelia strain d4-2]
MVNFNIRSQTYPKDNKSNPQSRDTIESLDQCALTIDNGGPHQENCTICYKKLCSKCFKQLELFSSKRTQAFQCPHCEEIRELKNTIKCFILNTLQLILLLSTLPIVAFALALIRTEKLIQVIETKIESICIILIVNLLLSIPIYIGELIICIFIAPFQIILGFQEAIRQRDLIILKRVFSQQ